MDPERRSARPRSSRKPRGRRAIGIVAVLGLWILGGVGEAIETPPELNFVCVDKRDRIFQVTDLSHCENGERSFTLPQDRPFHMCADRQFGRLRFVHDPSSCNSAKETAFTVPDSGAIYVCSRNARDGTIQDRGLLRQVSDAAVCDPRDETAYATPAAPVAADDVFRVHEDALLDVPARGPLENDVDLTGEPLTARLVSAPADGPLTLEDSGAFTYDPRGLFDHLDQGQLATRSFRYVADDGALVSAPATVTLEIEGRNDAPVSSTDTYTTDEDTPLLVAGPGVLGNDTDAEAHPLTAHLVTGPSKGALTLGTDGSFRYEPRDAFETLGSGDAQEISFTYVARDGTTGSAESTVTIRVTGVNDVPDVGQDSYAVHENDELTVPAPGLLENDADVDSSTLTVSGATLVGITPPPPGSVTEAQKNAMLTTHADGSFVYDPTVVMDFLASGQTGSVVYDYRASDGEAITTGRLTFDVAGLSPPAALNDTLATHEDRTNELDVLANDTPEGATLTAPWTGGTCTAPSGDVDGPDADGVLSYDPRAAFDALPAAGTGTDAFCYRLVNDEGAATGTVDISIAGRNDAPAGLTDTYEEIPEDQLFTKQAPGVLGNDSDPDTGETATLRAVLVSPPSLGRVTLRSDGSFDYEPAGELRKGQTATTSFAYRARDAQGAESASTTVTLSVEGVNAKPVIANQAFPVNEKSPQGTVIGTIAFSDQDAGDTHTLAVTAGDDDGFFTIVGSELRIASASGPTAAQGPFELTVQVTDAEGASASATVTVNVIDVNDPPGVTDDVFSTIGNTRLVVGGASPAPAKAFRSDPRNVLANDQDEDGDPLSAIPAAGATSKGGSYQLFADGSFRYDPPAGVTAADTDPDTFTYRITDGTIDPADAPAGTVEIVIEDTVWYLDNQASGPGGGTSAAPFTALSSVNGTGDPDGDGDTIYLFHSPDAYGGGMGLESSQSLLGQGVDLRVGGHLLVPADEAPTISSTGVAGVTLGTGNTVRGVAIATTNAPALKGNGFGTATLQLGKISSTGGAAADLEKGTVQQTVSGATTHPAARELASSNPAGDGLRLVHVSGSFDVPAGAISGVPASGAGVRVDLPTTDAPTPPAPLQATIGASISSAAGHPVVVTGKDGGSLLFSGPVSSTGKGISIDSSAALTSFTGGLTLATGANDAFAASSGGEVAVSGASNTIATTTGVGLRVENTAIAASGLRFRSIATDGAPQGIVLQDTGTVGGLTVSGGGDIDGGGVIRNATTGISLTETAHVSLNAMRITQSFANGVHVQDASDVTLTGVTIEDSGGNGVLGERVTGFRLVGSSKVQRNDLIGVSLQELRGSSEITESLVDSSRGVTHIFVKNTGASVAQPAPPADVLRIESMRFEDATSSNLRVEAHDDANLQVLVGSPTSIPSFFTGGTHGIEGRAIAGGFLDIAVTKFLRQGGSGDAIKLEAETLGADGARAATLHFDVFDNNTERGGRIFQPGGSGVSLLTGPGGRMSGSAFNNEIVRPGTYGVLGHANGGRLDPVIGSNQITEPGCFLDGVDRCRHIVVDAKQVCPTLPSGTVGTGVRLLAQPNAGVAIINGAVRRNEVPDPLGSGVHITAASAGTSATVEVSGNRVTESTASAPCSMRATQRVPIHGETSGGTLVISGGKNTVALDDSLSDGIVMEATGTAAATVDLAEDTVINGGHGVRGTARNGASLDIDVDRLARLDGTGHGIFLEDRDTKATLTFDLTHAGDGDRDGIESPGAHGIFVHAQSPLTTPMGTIDDNDITDAGGTGIKVLANGPTGVDGIVVEDNVVDTTAEDGISVGTEDPAGRLEAKIRRNTVTGAASNGVSLFAREGGRVIADSLVHNNIATNPGQRGILILADPTTSVTTELTENKVTQTLAHRLLDSGVALLAEDAQLTVTGEGNTSTGEGNTVTRVEQSSLPGFSLHVKETRDHATRGLLPAASATVSLTGDHSKHGGIGFEGLAERGPDATAGADVALTLSGFKRTKGGGDGINLRADGADSDVDFTISQTSMQTNAGITSSGEDGIDIAPISGGAVSGTVDGVEITDPKGNGIVIEDAEETLVVRGTEISNPGGDAIDVRGSSTAAMTARVDDNTITEADRSISLVASGAPLTLSASGNDVTGGTGMVVSGTTSGLMDATLDDNVLSGIHAEAMDVVLSSTRLTLCMSGNALIGGATNAADVVDAEGILLSATGMSPEHDCIPHDTTAPAPPAAITISENSVADDFSGTAIEVELSGRQLDVVASGNDVSGDETTDPATDTNVGGDALRLFVTDSDPGTTRSAVSVDGNVIGNDPPDGATTSLNGSGILLVLRGQVDPEVTSNTIAPAAAGGPGLEVVGIASESCLTLTSNKSIPPDPRRGFRLDANQATVFELDDRLSGETTEGWATRKNNTGTIEASGASTMFGNCAP